MTIQQLKNIKEKALENCNTKEKYVGDNRKKVIGNQLLPPLVHRFQNTC